MTLRLRDATEADRPTLARLHLASWRDAYRGILSDAFLDDEAEAERTRHWRTRPIGPEDVALIAELEGRPAGFVFVEVGESAFVDNLHVLTEARGRGVGRALLREAAGRLAGRGLVGWLTVFEANGAARAFYARLGGRETGRETDRRGPPVFRVEWRPVDAILQA